MKKIKVIRGFFYAGKSHVAGEVIEVPISFAIEIVAMGKAEYYIPKEEKKK